jgi:hypothetical protein
MDGDGTDITMDFMMDIIMDTGMVFMMEVMATAAEASINTAPDLA